MATCKMCGASGIFLKVNADRLCLSCVSSKLIECQNKMTPDIINAQDLKEKINTLSKKKIEIQSELSRLSVKKDNLERQIIQAEDIIEYESFALYRPRYSFVHSDEFKQELVRVRDKQKEMIKSKTAVNSDTNWTVNNSHSEGRKMVNDTSKLLLRSFNNECEVAISNVKFNNFDRAVARIRKSYDTINTLGRVMNISINPLYLEYKFDELHLAYEYAQKKEEEKQELRELREQQREEARAARELEEARRETVKEKQHYEQAIEKAKEQLASTTDEDKIIAIKEKIESLNTNIEDVIRRLEDIDYRQRNQKAGYVYVISNVGSFGKDIYKIGMTRRLEPYDRIRELGDASVPFYFDVHAMIFSEDAPQLEAALHQAFSERRINKVNSRKEYFKVTLEEIKEVIKNNHDKTVDYYDVPEAKEYRESLIVGS